MHNKFDFILTIGIDAWKFGSILCIPEWVVWHNNGLLRNFKRIYLGKHGNSRAFWEGGVNQALFNETVNKIT